jgi:hypothetical protein
LDGNSPVIPNASSCFEPLDGDSECFFMF